MDLIVRAPAERAIGSAEFAGRVFSCALGAAGILERKREGDRGTPSGRFPFREILYRADRVAAPKSGLRLGPIRVEDGWCDDPAHPSYNRKVRLPFAASHERLWRDDRLYDLVVVIGHNDDPPRPGFGSAVFIHLARPDFAPTEGCIAFHETDLRVILAAVAPGDCVDARLI
jgi:L,D-peptidoglycan transpeptidase YkuD (ErfK/YbiS/YcfS/YnhG family)